MTRNGEGQRGQGVQGAPEFYFVLFFNLLISYAREPTDRPPAQPNTIPTHPLPFEHIKHAQGGVFYVFDVSPPHPLQPFDATTHPPLVLNTKCAQCWAHLGAGSVQCHATEGIAEERRGGGSGSGGGRRAGVGSVRGSPYKTPSCQTHKTCPGASPSPRTRLHPNPSPQTHKTCLGGHVLCVWCFSLRRIPITCPDGHAVRVRRISTPTPPLKHIKRAQAGTFYVFGASPSAKRV